MNRRVWVCVGLIFGCLIVINGARGQTLSSLPGTGIPTNIKNSANAASFVTQIRQFIQDQVTRLQGDDVAAQSAARNKLIAESARGSTPSFNLVYAKEWSTAAAPLMAATSPLRLRLNVAIISASIAENSQAMEIEPVVRLILADKEGSVALWGVKGAKPLVGLIVQAPPVTAKNIPAVASSKLIAALVATVKSHSDSDLAGFITADTYNALVVTEVPGLASEKLKPLLPPLVGPILTVLEDRVSQYAKGAIPSPGAEREVTTFLSSNYPSVSRADQNRIILDLVTLITYAGQRSSMYTSKTELSQLREMIKYASQALVVPAANQGVESGLTWLTSIPPSSSTADIESHTKQVWATLQLVFKSLPKPAAIPVMVPPPPAIPTVAPTPGASVTPAR